jgi:siroheme decarboxylase
VMERIRAMLASGAIRRIAVVPNHYRLGWTANGMCVFDVDDAGVDALGANVGALPFVSHCYRRPRELPAWRYNLFAMVHGRDRHEVLAKAAKVAAVLGPHSRAHDVLFSTRILKKTGLRFGGERAHPEPLPHAREEARRCAARAGRMQARSDPLRQAGEEGPHSPPSLPSPRDSGERAVVRET